MDFLLDALTDWLKEMLVGGIMSNLSGMFDSVNQQVADIATQVGQTPQGWNGSIFSMIQNLSNSIMVPIAGVILAIVMTLELIQMITDKNNLHDVDTWMIFKWVFKSAAAILIVSNTWNIVMGVFDAAQSVVTQAAGIIGSDASIDISSVMTDMESRLMDMDLGPLFGLWFQSIFIGITMWALYICIFIVIYGRMLEIYLVASVAPIPMAIIVKDFSRFGRNSIETGYFIERVFPLFHTRFISINDDFDSDQHKGDTGGMDVAFKYLISEYYSRDMSIKTKSAKYAKMQRGEYQSKVCPYGYRKSADGRMEPNPETAAVVQLIFQLAATGIGAAAVTRELFKRGIPTPGEYKAAHGQQYHDVSRSRGRWSSSTVLRILEDERYIGSYVIGRRAVIEVGGTRSRRKNRDKWFIIPDHHPAIVDKELFEKVQAVQRRFSLPTRKTREYPLKGKVYCGCCDHALSRIAQKRPFYMCRHSTADVNSRCRDVRADVAGLEEAVLLTLKKQLEILLPVHKDGTIHLEATAAKCSEYEKQLEALKDQKQALFERYLLGQIELDTYKSEKAVYDAEILKVKNAYAAVTAQAKLKREEQARQSSRQEIVHSIVEADVLTSELTDLLIEKVYVFPDNRIEIVYKVHDLFE